MGCHALCRYAVGLMAVVFEELRHLVLSGEINCSVNTSNFDLFTRFPSWLHIGMLLPMKVKPTDNRNPVSTALGDRLKACRIEAKKSQEQLAFDALVDRGTLSVVESGRGNPTVEMLANICYCLDITLAEFFEPLAISLKPSGERRANAAQPEEIPRKRLR